MLINNLEQMEKVVQDNKSLSWDGWDVVELVKSQSAMFKNNGAFVNNQWYIKNTFKLSRDGWSLPNRYKV